MITTKKKTAKTKEDKLRNVTYANNMRVARSI